MARQPPNILALFAQALKNFESSDATFRVLCSLPAAASAAETNGDTPDVAVVAEPPPRPPKHILVLDSSFNPPTLAHHRMAISALSDPRYKTKVPQDTNIKESHGMSETTASSRVLLLLAIQNADKAPKPASFPQRLAMMYLFAQDILAEAAQKRHAESNSNSNFESDAPQPIFKIGCEAVDIAVTTEPYFHAKAQAIAITDFYLGTDALEQDESAVSMDNAVESEQMYLVGYDTLIRIFDPKYYPEKSMRSSLDPFFAHAGLRITMRTDDSWGDAAAQIGFLDELRGGRLEAVGGRAEWVDRIEMVQGRKSDEAVVSSTKVRDAVRKKDWGALEVLVGEGVVRWIRENGLYDNDDV